jgi:hypothetical protein
MAMIMTVRLLRSRVPAGSFLKGKSIAKFSGYHDPLGPARRGARQGRSQPEMTFAHNSHRRTNLHVIMDRLVLEAQ